MTASARPSPAAEAGTVDLVREAVRAVAETFTTSGHLAQRVDNEHLGYCSCRRCDSRCVRQWERFERLMTWLEAQGIEPPVSLEKVS